MGHIQYDGQQNQFDWSNKDYIRWVNEQLDLLRIQGAEKVYSVTNRTEPEADEDKNVTPKELSSTT